MKNSYVQFEKSLVDFLAKSKKPDNFLSGFLLLTE